MHKYILYLFAVAKVEELALETGRGQVLSSAICLLPFQFFYMSLLGRKVCPFERTWNIFSEITFFVSFVMSRSVQVVSVECIWLLYMSSCIVYSLGWKGPCRGKLATVGDVNIVSCSSCMCGSRGEGLHL